MTDNYLLLAPSEQREADTELALEMSATAYALARYMAEDDAALADVIGAEPASIFQLRDFSALGWF